MKIISRAKRSYIMSQIRSKDTKPELLVRRYLFSKGFRYRIHDPKLPGKPDIVLPKYKTVIMVHGCFWHGHEKCGNFAIPKTRTKWWTEKINRNKERDKDNMTALEELGWNVLIIHECQLKTNVIKDELARLEKLLLSGR